MAGRFLCWLRAAMRDCRGNAMIEFAVAAPVMILLYVGSVTYSDEITCSRKVTITARTITDLATRYPSMTEADARNVLNASVQVMAPYSTATAEVVMSEVKVTDSTHAVVVWSRNLNGNPLALNLVVTIPANMAATGTYLILGQVNYVYTPASNFMKTGPVVLSDSILMLPRVSDQVPITP